MPIYEYTCPSCNATFEEWVKSATDANSDYCACPQCNAKAQRMMSSTTFILKGGGWYVTEYTGKTTEPEKSNLNPETDSADNNMQKTEESTPPASPETNGSGNADKAVNTDKAETKNSDAIKVSAKATSAGNSGTKNSTKNSTSKNSPAPTSPPA